MNCVIILILTAGSYTQRNVVNTGAYWREVTHSDAVWRYFYATSLCAKQLLRHAHLKRIEMQPVLKSQTRIKHSIWIVIRLKICSVKRSVHITQTVYVSNRDFLLFDKTLHVCHLA